MTDSQKEFKIKMDKEWAGIHKGIFGNIIPSHSEWTDIDDIIQILNIIGGVPSSNHLFFPSGGGLDLLGAKRSFEKDCIELLFGASYIIKPRMLSFESFDNNDFEWNYFRIETEDLKPTGIYPVSSESFTEELCELKPLEYVKRYHWEENEFDGEELPKTARLVVRFYKGAFVIFKKSSIYNGINSTYDGRHSKMNASEFKKYIKTGSDSYKELVKSPKGD